MVFFWQLTFSLEGWKIKYFLIAELENFQNFGLTKCMCPYYFLVKKHWFEKVAKGTAQGGLFPPINRTLLLPINKCPPACSLIEGSAKKGAFSNSAYLVDLQGGELLIRGWH